MSSDSSYMIRSGLDKYKGTWGSKQVLHLIRRSLFGVRWDDYHFFSARTLDECLDVFLTPSPAPSPPLNAYNTESYSDPYVPFGETWVFCPHTDAKGMVDKKRMDSIRAWWIGVLLHQDRSLTEKMTLFWHNHAPISYAGTYDVRSFYGYIAPMRANSLGNFKKLMYDVTTSVGMMQYLCSVESNAVAPNENYSREFQELFTIGKGPDSHYTQDDVVAAARLLTGWTQDSVGTNAMFRPEWHDMGDKQFSAFYNNTIIKGRSGQAGAGETRELVDMIFATREVAKHTCRCLYRWFVKSDIDQSVEVNIIGPLADIFINSKYEIIPVLRKLLESEHFFDEAHIGCQIKNPVDHLIGICRQFDVTSYQSDLSKQYQAWATMSTSLLGMSMSPGDPPSVAGWPAYYLSPSYDRLWINSDTLTMRHSATDTLLSSTGIMTHSAGTTIQINALAYTASCPHPSDIDRLIADSTRLLSPVPFDINQVTFLKGILDASDKNNQTWQQSWSAYAADKSNTKNRNEVLERLNKYYTYIFRQMECQLI